MPTCNVTLTDERIGNSETPLWHGGTFHHLVLAICAAFGLVAVSIAFWLIACHATHYSKPWEQRHIIRILLMIPVYAIVAFLSFMYYWHAIYFQVLGNCYEAFAIASFFTLLCHYIAPDLHEQKIYFRQLTPRNWVLPINWFQKCTGGTEKGALRRPRSGLTWFNVIWIGVFQYCFIRVLFTIVAVLSQVAGRYCEPSLNPAFAHIWVMVFETIAVCVAMYCLIQFYIQLRKDLASNRPFLKILCIKLVIFFSFWQTTIISFLSSSSGPLKPSAHIAYPDISVGIPAMLICFEMAIFAVMHIFAFSWKPYTKEHGYGSARTAGAGDGLGHFEYQGGKLGWRALVDAFNPWDIVKASARGARWLVVGRRKRFEDVSYAGTKLDEPPAGSICSFGAAQQPYDHRNPFADTAAGGPPTIKIQPPSLRTSRAFTGTRTDGFGAGIEEDDKETLIPHAQRPSGLETPRSVGGSDYGVYFGAPSTTFDAAPVGDLGAMGLYGSGQTSRSGGDGNDGRAARAVSGSTKAPRESVFREEEDTGYYGAARSSQSWSEPQSRPTSRDRPGMSRENSTEWSTGDEAVFSGRSGRI